MVKLSQQKQRQLWETEKIVEQIDEQIDQQAIMEGQTYEEKI